jgi:Lrp/AsnC family transcriptional regulator, leucine-responsive regulatory protein
MKELCRVKEKENKLFELDKLDKKILRSLFSNKRQSYKDIGKLVRASKEVVNYRINRLKDNGILRGTVTILDNNKLGYNVNIVYYKLQKIDKLREKEIIEFFVNNKYVKVIATCTGNWDMFVVFCTKDLEHLHKILSKFDNFLSINLKRKRVATILEEHFLPFDYIIDRDNNGVKNIQIKEDSKIDNTDLEILKVLTKNTNFSLVDIARKIKLTPEAIAYRIRNLIQEQVIISFFPLINITLLGYHWYTVSLFLHQVSNIRQKQLIKYLKQHPNIICVIKTVGDWDIEFDIHVESSYKFRSILMEIRELFSDIINDFESNLIFNDYKYTHLPKGIKISDGF